MHVVAPSHYGRPVRYPMNIGTKFCERIYVRVGMRSRDESTYECINVFDTCTINKT